MLNIVTFVLYGALISSGVYIVLFLNQTAGYSVTAAGLAAAIPMVVLFFHHCRAGHGDAHRDSATARSGPTVPRRYWRVARSMSVSASGRARRAGPSAPMAWAEA